MANFVELIAYFTVKTFHYIALVFFTALILGSCSKKRNFTIAGELEDTGTQLVTATYYAAGGIKQVSASSAEGKFLLKCDSPRPTLVTITLSDGTVLGYCIAENGDEITVTGNPADPYKMEISGNGDTERISDWINENSELLHDGDAAKINASIAKWVGGHKSSKAATALMVMMYHTEGFEHQADSLMTMLNSDARAPEVVQNFTSVLSSRLGTAETENVPSLNLFNSRDSLIMFSPQGYKMSVLCFMPDNAMARDSVTRRLKTMLANVAGRRVAVVEISTAIDSAAWRRSLSGDSTTWQKTWAPATVASSQLRRLAVGRVPYFIVADSSARQVCRTSSVNVAAFAVERKFGK